MDLISGPWRARRGDFPWVISGPTGHISSLLWPYLLVKVWCLDWRHRWKWVLWGWSTASGTANWSQSSSAKDGMAKCPPKEGCCEKGPALNGIKTHTHTHVLLWWAWVRGSGCDRGRWPMKYKACLSLGDWFLCSLYLSTDQHLFCTCLLALSHSWEWLWFITHKLLP